MRDPAFFICIGEEGITVEMDNERPQGRIPPQDLDAEMSVLGALLLEPKTSHEIMSVLKEDDFYRPAHGRVYEAMVELISRSEAVDEVTVAAELKKMGHLEDCGGRSFIAQLSMRVPSAANIGHYARIVQTRSKARKLIKAATTIASGGYDNTADVDQLLADAGAQILELASNEDTGLTQLKSIVQTAFGQIEERYKKKQDITGVATGFKDFDRITAGFQPGDLVIVAGRPSMGKTALAINMATNAALRTKVPTAIFSLEMSKESLVMRMLAAEGRISGERIRNGKLIATDWPKLARACGMLTEAPVYIDDSGGMTITELRSKCMRLHQEKALGLVMIDYLQLMSGRGGNEGREKEISEISRGLKALAKDLKIPVVALSQLNRSLEQRQDKRPMMSDLRESGAIEQDADLIVFVYRDEYYNEDSADKGLAEVIIGKQRNGSTGTVKLKWWKEFIRFADLSPQEQK
jgi:replicative DNA helicase